MGFLGVYFSKIAIYKERKNLNLQIFCQKCPHKMDKKNDFASADRREREKFLTFFQ